MLADVYDLVPTFFVPGRGSTPIQEWVLGSAIALFALAAGLFEVLYRRSPSKFIGWYSIGLALIALGLAGVFGEHQLGGLLGWTARAAHYVGCTLPLGVNDDGIRAHGRGAARGADRVGTTRRPARHGRRRFRLPPHQADRRGYARTAVGDVRGGGVICSFACGSQSSVSRPQRVGQPLLRLLEA
jgi:hypothetical protein